MRKDQILSNDNEKTLMTNERLLKTSAMEKVFYIYMSFFMCMSIVLRSYVKFGGQVLLDVYQIYNLMDLGLSFWN